MSTKRIIVGGAVFASLALGMAGLVFGIRAHVRPPPSIVMERDARLVSIARAALIAKQVSLDGAIYRVGRDNDGWFVKMDSAPNYTGVGEPPVVADGSIFVYLTSDEKVREIWSYPQGKWKDD